MALVPPVDAAAAVPSLRTLGTGATQAAAGNDSRFTDSRAPTGSAGGVLDGTYPSPGLAAGVAGDGLAETSDVLSVNVDGSTLEISSDALRVKDSGITSAKIADGAIVNADVNASAAIAYSKLNLASSIVSGDITDGTIAQGDLATAAITALSGFSTAWTVIVKSIDESVTGSTTVQPDDELVFTPVSGGLYEVELFLILSSPSATPDFKMAFAEDATIRGIGASVNINSADAGTVANLLFRTSTTIALAVTTGTPYRTALLWGTYWGNGSSAGLQWAQNTSDGTNATIVKAGSVLRYRRIL